jgi:hypothetical protein
MFPVTHEAMTPPSSHLFTMDKAPWVDISLLSSHLSDTETVPPMCPGPDSGMESFEGGFGGNGKYTVQFRDGYALDLDYLGIVLGSYLGKDLRLDIGTMMFGSSNQVSQFDGRNILSGKVKLLADVSNVFVIPVVTMNADGSESLETIKLGPNDACLLFQMATSHLNAQDKQIQRADVVSEVATSEAVVATVIVPTVISEANTDGVVAVPWNTAPHEGNEDVTAGEDDNPNPPDFINKEKLMYFFAMIAEIIGGVAVLWYSIRIGNKAKITKNKVARSLQSQQTTVVNDISSVNTGSWPGPEVRLILQPGRDFGAAKKSGFVPMSEEKYKMFLHEKGVHLDPNVGPDFVLKFTGVDPANGNKVILPPQIDKFLDDLLTK